MKQQRYGLAGVWRTTDIPPMVYVTNFTYLSASAMPQS
jgi:hypothetical protein